MLAALSINLWWGKAVGLMVGWLLAGWPGSLLGLLLGQVFDRQLQLEPLRVPTWRGAAGADAACLAVAFALLGRMAALGGDRNTAPVAEEALAELKPIPSRRRCLRSCFEAGAAANPPPLELLLRRLSVLQDEPPATRAWLLNRLWRQAAAGGAPTPAQLELLEQVGRRLGPQAREDDHRRSADAARRAVERHLEEAFALLGLDAGASIAEVKRAYRRAVARHHPDRLLSQGAAEPQIHEATRLTRAIRAAYDEIRAARGF